MEFLRNLGQMLIFPYFTTFHLGTGCYGPYYDLLLV